MNAATLAGLCGAALVGLGLFGFVTHPHLLRKILAFNLLGSGVFLLFAHTCGSLADYRAAAHAQLHRPKAQRGFEMYVLTCHYHLVCGTIETDQGRRRLRVAGFNLVPETVS